MHYHLAFIIKRNIFATDYGTLYTPVFTEGYLEGAVFDITAKEDIYTPDGTLRYSAGKIVDTLTTTSEGIAISKELYLGTYIITESPIEVTIEYEDQLTPIVMESTSVENQRQAFSLTLTKECEVFDYADTNSPTLPIVNGEDFVFGLYSAEEIKYIPQNALVGIYETDKDGKIEFTDLIYLTAITTLQSLKAKTDMFQMISTILYQPFSKKQTTVKEISVNDGEAILNEFIKGDVVIR